MIASYGFLTDWTLWVFIALWLIIQMSPHDTKPRRRRRR